MLIMRKIIVILGSVCLLVGCTDSKITETADLKIEGKWKLAAGSQSSDCFAEMRFFENPESDWDPLSVHETKDNSTKVWYGEYEKKGNDIQIVFHEPKAEPFNMAADHSGDELKLRYEWKSAELTCSYQPN
ncbi:hypothetical protein [Paenibacillus nasutitermitis]|uniref:Lipocalin-like domain-containing protein n=1 Tax=Paenibacillus nasutitermitis TaxID=1652958 RepID=A0A916YU17_9BACL|nr:hypothetical protein [Paenibacillus nasutitermitis]GGD60483.1 hypothetical protein GCM10010911_17980 [Paenibacillus nasutitermitis]